LLKNSSYYFTILIGCEDPECEPENSDIITDKPELTSFHSISIDGSFNVNLIQSPIQEVSIAGPSNYVNNIEARVEDDVLFLSSQLCFENSSAIDVDINLTELRSLTVDGSGSVFTNNTLATDDLEIDSNGSADIDLIVENESISTTVDGSGSISILGTTFTQEIVINNSGDYSACGLASDMAFVTIQGSGDVGLAQCDEINAIVDGSGSVTYEGNPVVNSTINGSGEVEPGNCQ